VCRLLPIAECVVLLDRYVESRLAFEFGTVCHAFAAALRVVLDDWKLMVAQLEHQMLAGKGTLQALWFYCQPALVVLELAASALSSPSSPLQCRLVHSSAYEHSSA
jgi:gamma-tubulin complex component 2